MDVDRLPQRIAWRTEPGSLHPIPLTEASTTGGVQTAVTGRLVGLPKR
ncbi:hypothetical protein I546_6647 [Mycobacterium kansasii 732]|nr:hypothetical protein I546_6647 [Mycobacterium kansasii 732]